MIEDAGLKVPRLLWFCWRGCPVLVRRDLRKILLGCWHVATRAHVSLGFKGEQRSVKKAAHFVYALFRVY